MGRIGQSLIMPGQPPYCSLFSVCRADDGRRRVLVWGVGACVYISMRRARWDRAMAGKKDPTLSHPPTPLPHVSASPNWILYYRSSQVWTTHFPLPLSAFSVFHSPSLTLFFLSFFLAPVFLYPLSVCGILFFPSTSISFLLPSTLLFLLLALRVLFCLFFESLDSWQILSTAGCSLQWTCVL